MKNKTKNYDKDLYKFRRYKVKEGSKTNKSRHPKLIVDKTAKDYGFMGLTKSRKNGHKLNIPLEKNPQNKNTSQSYLRKDLRYDSKNNFGDVLKNYNLSEKDKQKIIKIINKKNKN